jgi:hypothetical protein
MMVWDACTSEPQPLLRWVECHPALGAYLTLGAIIAAIWATLVTLSVERRRTEARGRVIAFRLSPFLVATHTDIERALKCADDLEPGTNDFSRFAVLIEGLRVPTTIPEDLFRDTWAMPPAVALIIARLESALANYATVTAQPGLSSLGVIPQCDRSELLTGIRNMLVEIDTQCLVVSRHCARVAEIAVKPPLWRRWRILSR